jgi:hypothetical protein
MLIVDPYEIGVIQITTCHRNKFFTSMLSLTYKKKKKKEKKTLFILNMTHVNKLRVREKKSGLMMICQTHKILLEIFI